MSDLSADYVRSLLSYEPETGIFTWRRWMSPTAPAGGKAGGLGFHGYLRICIKRGSKRKFYLAHRLAWLYSHGEWPPCDIDHINGDKTCNVISNLRLATKKENSRNQVRRGYWFDKKSNKYVVMLGTGSARVYVGGFDDPEIARAAYVEASERLYGEFSGTHRSRVLA